MAPFAYILTNLIPYLLQYAGADYLGEVVLAVRLPAEKDHEVAYRSTHLSLPALPTPIAFHRHGLQSMKTSTVSARS